MLISSVVWQLFTQLSERLLQCDACGHKLTRGAGGSTSNALLHAKNHHPEAVEEAERAKDLEEGAEGRRAWTDEDGMTYRRRARKRTSIVWNFFAKQVCTYIVALGEISSRAALTARTHFFEQTSISVVRKW